MSEEPLEHSAKTVEQAREKVDDTPIMPFEGDERDVPEQPADEAAEAGADEDPADDPAE